MTTDAHGSRPVGDAGIVVLATSTFSDALAHGTWLVDFWAEWCEPCHALHRVLEEVVRDLPPGVAVGRVEITEEPEVARRYGITSVPTLVVFHDGEARRRLYGVKNRRQILAAVEAVAPAT